MFLFPVGSAGNEVNSNLRTPTSEIKKAWTLTSTSLVDLRLYVVAVRHRDYFSRGFSMEVL
jgi:hypothetical protein